MTDFLRVLPNFPVQKFTALISAIESQGLTTTDLITLDAAEIGKRTHQPLLDIKRLSTAILNSLHADLGISNNSLKHPPPPNRISLLSPTLDSPLSGGIPTSAITEFTSASGAGKTQFLLTLLLSVQLPPSHGGLSKNALYISTESPLSTRRLSQILNSHPILKSLPPEVKKPTLDNIISTCTPDLESQDHILTFQVPVEIQRRNIGLLVIDSIAANYRAEFERKPSGSGGVNMGARTTDLIKLGMHLRDLAQRYDLAIVVSNQVADRFSSNSLNSGPKTPASSLRSGPDLSSPLLSRSRNIPVPSSSLPDNNNNNNNNNPSSSLPPPPYIPPPEDDIVTQNHPALLLDHQQNFFTGWGDNPHPLSLDHPLKTPSLGLVWSTQISARIALFKQPVYNNQGGAPFKRWLKVVWGNDMPATSTSSTEMIEYEIWMGGVRGIGDKEKEKEDKKEEEL
ncbi:P-loop containing nucleoside triphosphate hydrolase protein [Podospora fimiseda]|uniref:P-loop containing nucleoside triphosphate hydrolase protein n=1 Tax=Podospora fimiseda TaxID=252190 RepID=A0AAN7BR80_9PEZI|nr:P-loop containing nucleoside triphosphate hydrolase protein [Podospora fimiseda]